MALRRPSILSFLRSKKGCVIPDSSLCPVALRDGESISIDWHVSVYEELLNAAAIGHVGKHSSVDKESAKSLDTKVPLSACMDKFTEKEKLDGMKCPKCAKVDCMHKSFTIWRQPPILIIQLKRFQYTHTSRRKLHQPVDFPLDNLDLSNYSATVPVPASQSSSQSYSKVTDGVDDANVTTGGTSSTAPPTVTAAVPPKYNLYSVIHHVGSLGGGHYVNTVRSTRTILAKIETINSLSPPASLSSSDQRQNSIFSAKGQQLPTSAATNTEASCNIWHCFNDNLITEVKAEEAEDVVASSSAYVLFYAQQDRQVLLKARHNGSRTASGVEVEETAAAEPGVDNSGLSTAIRSSSKIKGFSSSSSSSSATATAASSLRYDGSGAGSAFSVSRDAAPATPVPASSPAARDMASYSDGDSRRNNNNNNNSRTPSVSSTPSKSATPKFQRQGAAGGRAGSDAEPCVVS